MAHLIYRMDKTFDGLEPGETLELSIEIDIDPKETENTFVPTESDPIGSSAELKQDVINLVNVERARLGLAPLSNNTLLEQAAQMHTDDMRQRNFFEHDNPDGQGPFNRIEAMGYLQPYYDCNCTKSYATGENIAKGQSTAAEVMETWMNSAEHRDNILSADYNEIGIGVTPVDPNEAGFTGHFWTQNFGKITLN